MATGFSISVISRNRCLFVQIQGGFDGSAAQQLLYALKPYVDQFQVIIVDTDRISHVDVFGLNVFRYNLETLQSTSKQFRFIRFTGSKASVFQAAILFQNHLTGGESHACKKLDEQTRHYDR
ncbi:MAG: hypothetical protein HY881_17595 [Deltaproteobacteria bacterium]|nr:hypothetical protein [Deltaproteobacteria bacterium]